MKISSGGKLALALVLALVALTVQCARSPLKEAPKRATHIHAVAFDIATSTAQNNFMLPSSTSDPKFLQALPQELSELEKRFIFNTKLFGYNTLKMTKDQLRAPLVIQRKPLPMESDRVLLKFVDLEGEEHNVDTNQFPLSDLDDASRRQVEAIIAEAQ